MTIEDLITVYKKEYLTNPYHLWIVSDKEREEVLKKIKY